MSKANKSQRWDASSRNESDKNYVPGAQSMGNPWNNANNPNWRNNKLEGDYNPSMLNDPQRIQKQNITEDNNGNKKKIKTTR